MPQPEQDTNVKTAPEELDALDILVNSSLSGAFRTGMFHDPLPEGYQAESDELLVLAEEALNKKD